MLRLGMLTGLILTLISGNTTGQVIVQSTFDTGSDGWTLQAAEWFVDGGNPGGCLQGPLNSPGMNPESFAFAPPAFLGNWNVWEGVAVIEFDYGRFSLGSSPLEFDPLRIEITGGTAPSLAVWIGPGIVVPQLFNWHTFEVPLVSSAWSMEQGTWNDLLSDVQVVGIRIETVNNDGVEENARLDNVRIRIADIPPSDCLDAAVDFSSYFNPNGTCSLGWSVTPGVDFTPFAYHDYYAGGSGCPPPGCIAQDSWSRSAGGLPDVTQLFPSGVITASPAPTGESAVIRWIAPSAGGFRIDAQFWSYWNNPASDAGVLVLVNGVATFEGNAFANQSPAHAQFIVDCVTGDTVEFVVGVGPNGLYDWDRVMLMAQVRLTTVSAADIDGDGIVDNSDVDAFLACMAGPESLLQSNCLSTDMDSDSDGDLADFAILQREFGQPCR